MSDPKPVEFRGSALDDLRAFPASARREAGHQLDQVQHGHEPDDFQKKTQKTTQRDLDLAAKRYSDLVKELAQ
ncbi:Phage-related protein [Candidatus Accumulibacter aalborgensis]|uniref:Phage-related protein n=1 Tax=Candidatus Accumulibacter aalborgensis TaxID=1860102 RepID=A0A1A8XK46_9PROT|nr:hypothetical protein [Candidatus Accumulibacter aalborgensis]SBT04772.1 Phage-related protein [Candidatus Accumulibacter aalborgensis]